MASKPIRESIEKTGWKERPPSSRPTPPQGQGRTTTSVPERSPYPPQRPPRDNTRDNNR